MAEADPDLLPEIIVEAHSVSRPDLIRVNPTTGDIDEIVIVIIGGRIFDDWEAVWIQSSWNDPCARFRLTTAEREPYPLRGGPVLQIDPGGYRADPSDPLSIAPATECTIIIGGIEVVNGVIITRQVAYDANRHIIQFDGVSMSWYAARSSIKHKDSNFNGKSFKEIADIVLAPTGVKAQVVPTLDGTPFKSGAAPSPGETINQFLERLARDRKIIIGSVPKGDYLFIGEHMWPKMGDLIEGINIKKMQCIITYESAYQEYIARAQKIASDSEWGRKASEQEATVPGILNRYSVLLTALEHPVWTPAEVAKRAQTEKMWNEETTMIQATVTVYGWFRPWPSTVPRIGAVPKLGTLVNLTKNTLWQAGDEVRVTSPMCLLRDYPLKIRTVTWTQDRQNGTQTILDLTTPRGLNSRTPIPGGARQQPAEPNDNPAETPPAGSPISGKN